MCGRWVARPIGRNYSITITALRRPFWTACISSADTSISSPSPSRGADTLSRALAGGRGCLLLGSHLGSFEVVRAVGSAREEIDIKVLMDEGNAPLMRAFFREINPVVADNVLQVGRLDTMLRVQECLDGGGIVGIMGDRLISQGQAVYCDFLGATAPFPTGTMRLAHAVRAPVIMFFGLYRGGNRYDIHLELLSDRIQLSQDRREDDIRR